MCRTDRVSDDVSPRSYLHTETRDVPITWCCIPSFPHQLDGYDQPRPKGFMGGCVTEVDRGTVWWDGSREEPPRIVGNPHFLGTKGDTLTTTTISLPWSPKTTLKVELLFYLSFFIRITQVKRVLYSVYRKGDQKGEVRRLGSTWCRRVQG